MQENVVADRDGFLFLLNENYSKINEIILLQGYVNQISGNYVTTELGVYSISARKYLLEDKHIISCVQQGNKLLLLKELLDKTSFLTCDLDGSHITDMGIVYEFDRQKIRSDVKSGLIQKAGEKYYIIQQIGGKVLDLEGNVIWESQVEVDSQLVNELFVVKQHGHE